MHRHGGADLSVASIPAKLLTPNYTVVPMGAVSPYSSRVLAGSIGGVTATNKTRRHMPPLNTAYLRRQSCYLLSADGEPLCQMNKMMVSLL